jgi:hypothetical protein
MIWYIFAFLYFILVDVLIFTQKWTMLVVALIAGGVFLLIALVLRGLFPEKKASAPETSPGSATPGQAMPGQAMPGPSAQGYAPASATQQVPAQGQGAQTIGPDTRFGQAPQKDSTLPAVFFYIELLIALGLLVAILLK